MSGLGRRLRFARAPRRSGAAPGRPGDNAPEPAPCASPCLTMDLSAGRRLSRDTLRQREQDVNMRPFFLQGQRESARHVCEGRSATAAAAAPAFGSAFRRRGVAGRNCPGPVCAPSTIRLARRSGRRAGRRSPTSAAPNSAPPVLPALRAVLLPAAASGGTLGFRRASGRRPSALRRGADRPWEIRPSWVRSARAAKSMSRLTQNTIQQ
jgi:hypothetical protein